MLGIEPISPARPMCPSRSHPPMLIEHQSKRPNIHPTAYVAPTAVICGDVTIGPHTHVSFGAVIEAHGAPVRIGAQCVVRENLNTRSTSRNAVVAQRWSTARTRDAGWAREPSGATRSLHSRLV